jgi:hypothetical protein
MNASNMSVIILKGALRYGEYMNTSNVGQHQVETWSRWSDWKEFVKTHFGQNSNQVQGIINAAMNLQSTSFDYALVAGSGGAINAVRAEYPPAHLD